MDTCNCGADPRLLSVVLEEVLFSLQSTGYASFLRRHHPFTSLVLALGKFFEIGGLSVKCSGFRYPLNVCSPNNSGQEIKYHDGVLSINLMIA